jgi:copper chaperone CopZ
MKTKKIIFTIAIACFIITGCKKEVKKESVALAISGMTCEIGCAKTIQSKLSKKEGVLKAKVIFNDSIANIEFDANATSKKDLIAFVDGIAGGDLYSASETTKKVENTTSDKKAACCKKDSKGNMACLKDCKMACCADKKV